MTDEFGNVPMLGRLAEQQIASFMEGRVDPETIPLRRELLVKSYWVLRSNLPQIDKCHGTSIIGNKTPRAEHHFELFEQLFSVNKPIYVYCARNAHDVLRSIRNLKNIQWSRLSFEDLFERYKNSYRILKTIQDEAPFRTFVVNVDHFEQSELFDFYKPIFERLGIDYDTHLVDKVNAMGPRNTIHRVKNTTKDHSPIVPLSDDELAVIENCHEYSRIKEEFKF